MKKYFCPRLFSVLIFSFLIFHSLFAHAQLVKQWDYRFGGNGTDWVAGFQQTADAGYILCGYSTSGMNGDKTQATQGFSDYWIVKIDSLGSKQWDKRFGGSNEDVLYCIQQTSDGGYILGGGSNSPVSGDKSQPDWDVVCSIGCTDDFWIVKTDSLGNKLWDKRYGGTEDDVLKAIEKTRDGGYLLAGNSFSGTGGDKTQPLQGVYDYWVVKIDSLGSKIWDKDFGGTGNNNLSFLQPAADGAYLMGGSSTGPAGGDKTQPTQGDFDYWIVKIDSLGNKIWDKDFGGTNVDFCYAAKLTADGGFIIGGISSSVISGDKSQTTWGAYDQWIVKIDSLGNKQWDKDFGGTGIEDGLGSVVQTSDKGYLLCSNSFSNMSGDKTENNLAGSQAWVVKTDSLGNKEWDKTIFTNPETKVTPYAIQTRDGCYAIAEGTYGGIAGYKTQANRDTTNGSQDYWIIKFCNSTLLPVALVAASSPICPGTCIDFTNLSTNATSYLWIFSGASVATSTDANPTAICYTTPGSYDVTLIATNANGSDSLTLSNFITVYPQPAPQSITQSGDTLFAIAGAASYQWYLNGNIISGATNYFYVAQQSGDYNVVATDANGCEVEAAVFNVIAAAPPVLPEGEVITVAPNPVVDKFTIHNAQFTMGTAVAISIYNLIGEKVYSAVDCSPSRISPSADRLMTVDCGLLPQGMYWLEIISGDKIFRAKFVKQ